MPGNVVQVPASLLLAPDLAPTAKLIWMVSRLQHVKGLENSPTGPAARHGHAGKTGLAAVSGLSRPTVLKGLAQLTANGWDNPAQEPAGVTVPVPANLLTNRKLGAMSRVLYGLLPLTPGFNCNGGHFTYAELASLAHASPTTVTNAVNELVRAEWIKVERTNRLSRIQFELTFPGRERGLRAMAEAQERLNRPGPYGQALMGEWLTLLIDTDNYQDNTNPGFLKNPRTGALLQFDRFYPPTVAFEYNGPQHYRRTRRYTPGQVAAQRERDLIKLGICVTRGITLVTVQAPDLTLQTMRQKVGSMLPLRDLTGHGLLIEFLEAESREHERLMAKL